MPRMSTPKPNYAMSKIDYLLRWREIDRRIKTKSTGNTSEFATRLGISKSQLHEELRLMKELDAPIAYSRIRQTYYYNYPTSFSLTFTPFKENELDSSINFDERH